MDTKTIYLNVLPNLLSLFDFYSSKDVLVPRSFLKEESLKKLFYGCLHALSEDKPEESSTEPMSDRIHNNKTEANPPQKSIRHAHMIQDTPEKAPSFEDEPLVSLSLIACLLLPKLSDEKILVLYS